MDHCLCKGEVYANIIKILDPGHRILPNSLQFSLGEFSDIKERCRGHVRFSAILWGRLPQHSWVRTDVRMNLWMYGLRYVRKIFGQKYDDRSQVRSEFEIGHNFYLPQSSIQL